MVETDIDIDFQNPEQALKSLKHIRAINTNHSKHPSGVYFQNVPVNPVNNFCAYDHKEAAAHNFFKIDFLKNSIYDGIKDENHLIELLNREPNWSLFEQKEIISLLAQISEHHALIAKFKPRSIEELAVCLALIRPGKRHLQSKTKHQIYEEIWLPPTDGSYHYKKSHAIAYAASIVVQLNFIITSLINKG